MQVMQADNAKRAFRGNVAMQVHNLVDNFETKQCKWHHLMTKFWTSLQQIRKYTQKKYKSDFKKYNLKLRNMRASQLRFSSQTGQTLSTCVLILSSFLKRLDVFMHTLDTKFRYMITIIIVAQNDPIHHQAGIQSGSLVFSPTLEPSNASDFTWWPNFKTFCIYKSNQKLDGGGWQGWRGGWQGGPGARWPRCYWILAFWGNTLTTYWRKVIPMCPVQFCMRSS